jgi:hypothetical protein
MDSAKSEKLLRTALRIVRHTDYAQECWSKVNDEAELAGLVHCGRDVFFFFFFLDFSDVNPSPPHLYVCVAIDVTVAASTRRYPSGCRCSLTTSSDFSRGSRLTLQRRQRPSASEEKNFWWKKKIITEITDFFL